VAVPEASVDKNDRRIFRENNVRIAWQIFPMESKSKTEAMQQCAHDLLRACIP